MTGLLRIGIVGAGANTRLRHIPGFRAIENVEILGVVNRTKESTAAVAEEYGIPKTYPTWHELVADPEIDAVLIGTWPNLHCEVTCAALAHGKHVLTEARMSRDVAEAKKMLEFSQARPDLVAQIVPSPFGLEVDGFVQSTLKNHFLGDLREVVVIGADDQFWDDSQFMHWRQEREISGLNVLSLGILHETVSRWIPQPESLFAQMTTMVPERRYPEAPEYRPITVPDSVQVLTQYPGGARGIYHFSGAILQGPGKQIHLYGSHGTMKFEFGAVEKVWCGRYGDREMHPVSIPEGMKRGWRVEADFVDSIRTGTPAELNDFQTGLRYMEFTDAVHRSAELRQSVKI